MQIKQVKQVYFGSSSEFVALYPQNRNKILITQHIFSSCMHVQKTKTLHISADVTKDLINTEREREESETIWRRIKPMVNAFIQIIKKTPFGQ